MRKLFLLLFLSCLARLSFAQIDSLQLSGPYSYKGLCIVLISKPAHLAHPYLTLEQALATHRAIIHENNSQTLWIDNLSDTDLFIQSTDIIKGGQQDRMIANDMILPAKSSSHDLRVYCVEQGRSTKRGTEPIETFSASNEAAPISHMRVVARHELTGMLLTPHLDGGLTAPDPQEQQLFESLSAIPEPNPNDDAAQQSVWKDVSNIQRDLTRTLRDSVTKNESPTSLELALEHSSLQDTRSKYVKKLEDIIEDHPDCIGFVYAIDGHIVDADIYSSHALFENMWPKLLKAAATEAILSSDSHKPVTLDAVQDFLDTPTYGKTARKQMNDRTTIEAKRSEQLYKFLTIDSQTNSLVHESIVAK